MPFFTYSDLLEHVAGYLGKNASADGSSAARRAAQQGIENLQSHHDWAYYRTIGRIVTVAQYQTGTVAFDLTGGANERQLTLTGGTWPSWAAFGSVWIADVMYDVDERISDTIITLKEETSPGADIASGASYTLYRDTYPFPDDFQACGNMTVVQDSAQIVYRPPQSILEQRRVWSGTGRMSQFTIVPGVLRDGKMACRFYPPPDVSYTCDFAYKRRPRTVIVADVSDGHVTVTNGSTTVTGISTSFKSRHVGAILRVGTNSKDKPTGLEGINPFTAERRITAVASATSLTVEGAFGEDATRVTFCITDPIDIERGAMRVALLRLTEQAARQGCRIESLAGEPTELTRALTAARDADSRYYGREGVWMTRSYRNINDFPVAEDE